MANSSIKEIRDTDTTIISNPPNTCLTFKTASRHCCFTYVKHWHPCNQFIHTSTRACGCRKFHFLISCIWPLDCLDCDLLIKLFTIWAALGSGWMNQLPAKLSWWKHCSRTYWRLWLGSNFTTLPTHTHTSSHVVVNVYESYQLLQRNCKSSDLQVQWVQAPLSVLPLLGLLLLLPASV